MRTVEQEGRKDVPDRDGVLTSDGSRVRLERVGGSYDPSTLLDDILAFPDPTRSVPDRQYPRFESHIHGDDWGTRGDVLDETTVERSSRQVRVVLLGQSGRRSEGLDTAGVS